MLVRHQQETLSLGSQIEETEHLQKQFFDLQQQVEEQDRLLSTVHQSQEGEEYLVILNVVIY